MKKIILILISGLFLSQVGAQKVDLDPFNFNFTLRNLPHGYHNPDVKTYSVLVDVTGYISRAMSKEAIDSRIIIQGLEKEPSDGDIKISFRVDDLFIEKNKVVESVSESKNKDGSIS
ncbi:MAG: hypothetical protein HYZ42_00730, partial [Bacteroidetes bacterium]|nr:hypothetical protein [Bacteroidota bacterium]